MFSNQAPTGFAFGAPPTTSATPTSTSFSFPTIGGQGSLFGSQSSIAPATNTTNTFGSFGGLGSGAQLSSFPSQPTPFGIGAQSSSFSAQPAPIAATVPNFSVSALGGQTSLFGSQGSSAPATNTTNTFGSFGSGGQASAFAPQPTAITTSAPATSAGFSFPYLGSQPSLFGAQGGAPATSTANTFGSFGGLGSGGQATSFPSQPAAFGSSGQATSFPSQPTSFGIGGQSSSFPTQPTAITTSASNFTIPSLGGQPPLFGSQSSTPATSATTPFGGLGSTGQSATFPAQPTSFGAPTAFGSSQQPSTGFTAFGTGASASFAPASQSTLISAATTAAPTQAPAKTVTFAGIGQTAFPSNIGQSNDAADKNKPNSVPPVFMPSSATVASSTPLTLTTSATPFITPSSVATTQTSSSIIPSATSSVTLKPTSGFTITSLSTNSIATTTTTTSTSEIASTSSPQITFGKLEDQINLWMNELTQFESDFHSQGQTINSWDSLLISNGQKLIEMKESIEKLKSAHRGLDHQLDFIIAQQKELEQLLDQIEQNKFEISTNNVNAEREQTYSMVETVHNDLNAIGSDLKDFIKKLNETKSNQDSNDPIVQISKILNSHMDVLQWIENQIKNIKVNA